MLNLLEFIIPLAGKLICQLNADSNELDFTSHVTDVHRQCIRSMHADYIKLTTQGIATNNLVSALLRGSGFSDEHISTGMRMLAEFGLVVPFLKEDLDDESATTTSPATISGNALIIAGVDQYVVPSQLPPVEADSRDAGCEWFEGGPSSTCTIWFAPKCELDESMWLRWSDMCRAGFLTPGIFQRLVAMLMAHCQSANHDESFLQPNSIVLRGNLVILHMGGQYFRLMTIKEQHAVRSNWTSQDKGKLELS